MSAAADFFSVGFAVASTTTREQPAFTPVAVGVDGGSGAAVEDAGGREESMAGREKSGKREERGTVFRRPLLLLSLLYCLIVTAKDAGKNCLGASPVRTQQVATTAWRNTAFPAGSSRMRRDATTDTNGRWSRIRKESFIYGTSSRAASGF